MLCLACGPKHPDLDTWTPAVCLHIVLPGPEPKYLGSRSLWLRDLELADSFASVCRLVLFRQKERSKEKAWPRVLCLRIVPILR